MADKPIGKDATGYEILTDAMKALLNQYPGHNGSYILAMDMMPQRLRIADASEEYIYNEQDDEIENPVTEPERRGFFEKFKRKSELQEKSEKNINKSEKTAVALWKNNKIVLDNFTIQTFTNLKNMI